MAKGSLVPNLLTPIEAEQQLAIPCVLILAKVAQPVFPIGNRGAPSLSVLIQRVKDYDVGDLPLTASMLPMMVDWRQWRTAVVPVLEDEVWKTTNPITTGLLRAHGGADRLVDLMGRALKDSFISAGWGPSS